MCFYKKRETPGGGRRGGGGGGGVYGKFPNELRRSLWIKEALNSLHSYSSQAC